MDLANFAEHHRPALAADEARHNVILSILNRGLNDANCEVKFWTLGPPGMCAVQQAGYGIVLGDVGQIEVSNFTSEIRDYEFPSIMGPDLTATWFVESAKAFGHEFPTMQSQTIHILKSRPVLVNASGSAQLATMDDVDLVHDWLKLFVCEAVPHEQPATREEAKKRIQKNRVYLWCVDEHPVAMSCIGRTLDSGSAIAPVYTKPDERCRGYAAAVTAAVAHQVFDRGYQYVYLYTDNSNPASNRCYAKIGFRPHCQSRQYRRSTD